MSVSSILQTAHKLGMAGKLTQPRASQTAITLVLGFGQTIASNFYLRPRRRHGQRPGAQPDLYGPANYAYRSALLSDPAQLVQIGGAALYGFALAESPPMALARSAGLCLVMFSMTFGLERPLQSQKVEAAA